MTRYYTADLHLGHARILELCGRPFGSVDEMNEKLIDNINNMCSPEDELYILGDIALGKLDESLLWLGEINCKLIMIPGNHDRFSLAYQRKGDRIQKVLDQAQRYADYGVLYMEKLGKPSSWVSPVETGTGLPIVMSHYPYTGDSHGDDRHADMRPKTEGFPLIHGHVHTEWKHRGNMFNVGVDVNDFKPVSEEEILEWYATL